MLSGFCVPDGKSWLGFAGVAGLPAAPIPTLPATAINAAWDALSVQLNVSGPSFQFGGSGGFRLAGPITPPATLGSAVGPLPLTENFGAPIVDTGTVTLDSTTIAVRLFFGGRVALDLPGTLRVSLAGPITAGGVTFYQFGHATFTSIPEPGGLPLLGAAGLVCSLLFLSRRARSAHER